MFRQHGNRNTDKYAAGEHQKSHYLNMLNYRNNLKITTNIRVVLYILKIHVNNNIYHLLKVKGIMLIQGRVLSTHIKHLF